MAPPEAFEEDKTPAKCADASEPLRFSLAGIQMKFSAAGSPERGLTIPAEGRGGHWILKLPSERFPLVPENEHSMMQLARAVGIETADTGLVPVGEIERLRVSFRRARKMLATVSITAATATSFETLRRVRLQTVVESRLRPGPVLSGSPRTRAPFAERPASLRSSTGSGDGR